MWALRPALRTGQERPLLVSGREWRLLAGRNVAHFREEGRGTRNSGGDNEDRPDHLRPVKARDLNFVKVKATENLV